MIGWGGAFAVGVGIGPLVDAWITGRLAGIGLGRPREWRPLTRWVLTAALGVGWLLAVWKVGWTGVLAAHLVWVTVTAALVITDLEHRLIPNRILYPATGMVALLLAAGALFDRTPGRMAGAVIGAVLCMVGMGLLAVVSGGAMGMGDVKLSALLGLVCGYQGTGVALRAVLLGFVIGGAVALVLLLSRRAHRHTQIPFAPALVAGAWMSLL